ncbi:MAG: hypothetical protein ACJ746_10835 [Bryobacteraceae bacterium]
MNSQVDQIARALLYEGYLLYPYRPSALKNQQRWNFGVLYPPAWSARQTGSDRSDFQLECVGLCSDHAELILSIRFLQIVIRHASGTEWQEAIERSVSLDPLPVLGLAEESHTHGFAFPSEERPDPGDPVRKFPLEGQIQISSRRIHTDVFQLTVRLRNTAGMPAETRDQALLHSLASAHAVLQLSGGDFVSQIEPPENLRDVIAGCQNVGVWPVLIGEREVHDTILASPIILYDYPQIAPESKGDLFDGTEIDEILTLRILTLTDDEKEEVRRSDERARRILERLESSPPEHMRDLHGAMRGMRQPRGEAWSTWDTLDGGAAEGSVVNGVELKKGDRVRLRPQKRADIFDTLLKGRLAVIEAVEQDFENKVHFAVVLEDDPGKDLGEMRQAGHRFFFSAEEIEPLESAH